MLEYRGGGYQNTELNTIGVAREQSSIQGGYQNTELNTRGCQSKELNTRGLSEYIGSLNIELGTRGPRIQR
jgi:hypothetical protein